MIRRRKFQAKPNMSSATSLQFKQEEKQQQIEREQQEDSADPSTEVVTEIPAVENQSQLEQSAGVCFTELRPVRLPSVDTIFNHSSHRTEPNDFLRMEPLEVGQQLQIRPSNGEICSGDSYEQPTLFQQTNHENVERQNVHRQLLARVPSQKRESIVEKEKKRNEPLKDKLVDTRKFRMADLVGWKPKTENTLKKKWSEKRKQMKSLDGVREPVKKEEPMEELATSSEAEGTSAGPRVKINERGEMVVDEESLVVVENPENRAWETVNDDLLPKKLTSLSFRKYRRGQVWSVLETDLFYEVLAATGTDFALMHEFIPTRTRAELKKKFNKEERSNSTRLNETLRNPAMLDERLRERVERMLEEMGDKDE